jgi:hypothetical protein
MKIGRVALLLTVVCAGCAVASAQPPVAPEQIPGPVELNAPEPIDLTYVRPTQATKLRNYAFDAFGPYPIADAAVIAGVGQAENTPSSWGQGASGYGKRFASDFGIAAITTTARYGLAEALKEDTLYYRCECKGLLPRLGHAVVSSVTARHGADGHRAFSISAFAAPYAGTFAAVYIWYPNNYGPRSALRLGNLNLLGDVGQNILLEFFYSGPHSRLSRMHSNPQPSQAAPEPSHE